MPARFPPGDTSSKSHRSRWREFCFAFHQVTRAIEPRLDLRYCLANWARSRPIWPTHQDNASLKSKNTEKQVSAYGAGSWGSAALHPRLWLFRAFGTRVISLRSIPGYQCFAPSALMSSYHISERASAGGAKGLSLGWSVSATPGNVNKFDPALIRRYSVGPTVKNTRSPGWRC